MAKILALVWVLSIVFLAACSPPEPEPMQEDQAAMQDEVAETGDAGDAIEGEYVEVTVRNSSEPVSTNPMDILAQAQAAKDRGERLEINIK